MSEKKVIPAIEAVRSRIKYYEAVPWKNRKESLLKAVAEEDDFEVAAITYESTNALFLYAVTRMFIYGRTQDAKTFLIELANRSGTQKSPYVNLTLAYKIVMALLNCTTPLQTEKIDALYYVARHTQMLKYESFSEELSKLLSEAGKHKWSKTVRDIFSSYYAKKENIV